MPKIEESILNFPPPDAPASARESAQIAPDVPPSLQRTMGMIGWVFSGLLIGVLSAFSPGSVFIGAAVLVSWLLLGRRVVSIDRKFVATLFLAGFLVRMLLSLGLDLGSRWVEGGWPHKYQEVDHWEMGVVDRTRHYVKMGDSDHYTHRAYSIAQYAKGVREPVILLRLNQYGWNGYVYLMGLFFNWFGYSPGAVKFINCFLGAWLGVLTFFLTRSCFNRSIARGAALAVGFFPSLIVWSTSNLKDIPMLFLTLLLLLIFTKIQDAPSRRVAFRYATAFFAVFLFHTLVRSVELSALLLAGLIGSYLFIRFQHRKWLLAGIALILLAILMTKPVSTLSHQLLGELMNWHLGFVQTAGDSYRFLPEKFYDGGTYLREWSANGRIDWPLIKGLLQSIPLYLLQPFPERTGNLFRLLVIPQMLFWYVALLFSGLGMLWSLRWNLRRSLFLVVTILLWVSVSAISSGNIGTVMRIRDMVTPLFLIFASVGVWVLTKGRNPLNALDNPPAASSNR